MKNKVTITLFFLLCLGMALVAVALGFLGMNIWGGW
jgi:hypothetical protein